MFTTLLNKEMNVRTRTVTVDIYGGQTVTNTNLYTSIPCRVNSLSNVQQAELARSGIMATHKIICGGGYIFPIEAQLVVGDDIFEIVDVEPVTGMSPETHHLKISTRMFKSPSLL